MKFFKTSAIIFILMIAGASAATLPDMAPVITFSSNTQNADTATVLTAVAVDSLTNAGISSIEIFQDSNILERKSCSGKTCVFTKTIIETNAATHSYYAKATDMGSNVVQSSPITIIFKGIMKITNLPPSIERIGAKSVNEGSNLNFTVNGNDLNEDALAYSASNLPSGASFNTTTRVFSWTPDFTQAGNYPVTFKVSDGVYEYSETVAISVVNANIGAPVLASIGNKNVNTSQSLQFTLSATDPDNDALVYSASNLPQGASFSAATKTFSWTPSAGQAGSYQVTFTVSDGSLSDTETITITVTANGTAVNNPPVLASIGNKNVNTSQLLQFTISATDTDNDTLTYSASNLPSGVAFNTGTKTFSWTPSSGQTGNYQITFNVSDGKSSDYETITITVGNVNSPPVLASIGNKNVNTDNLLQFTVSATDPNNDTLSYSAYSLPSGASFNATTKTFSWTPSNSQAGSYQVTFNVSDGKLSDSETITITLSVVNVNQPPVLDSVGNKNVNENSLLQFTISATDANNDTLVYSASNLPSGASFNAGTKTFSWVPNYEQSGGYNVLFNVTDGSLSDSETITITVNDVQRCIEFNGSLINIQVVNASPAKAYTWQQSIGGYFSQLTVSRNRNITFIPTINNPDSKSLTYNWHVNAIGGLCSQLTFNYAFTQAGMYNVTLVVNDGTSNSSATWMVDTKEETIYGVIYDTNTGAPLDGMNLSFYDAGTFNPETNDTSAANNYDQLVPKAVPDTQTNAIGGFFMNLANGKYHVVIQGSRENDFDIQINSSQGKTKHDSEVNEDIPVTNFNAEGHIVHSGKYSDSNNYTCGNFVYFTMFGVNNGGTSETISFVIQDHTESGNPNTSPIIYNGSFSNPDESLTIPAGQKLNKMFKFKVPCNYSEGKYDIHVIWQGERWHKIGNFFTIPDTTLPYVYAWDSLTTYTNESLEVPCDGENLPQPGTIGYNEQVYYFMMEGYNEPKWGVTVCVDKDIATDGPDPDAITDNDQDGCMVNPPRFIGSEDLPVVNYSKSGHYIAKIFAFDEAGNTNSAYTNITVYANEAEANATAQQVYSRFYYNDYEQYNYTYWIASQILNVKLNIDRWDINATNIGDEYITPNDGFHGPNGINYTEIAAAEEANFHFPLGQFVKPIYSMTLEEYNYTLTSFCYHVMCNAGQMMDGQPGCHDENFAPQILRCTPYGGPTGLYKDTYGFTCIPKDVTMISASTTQFGAGGTWGMGFEPAVIDPNNDPFTVHWYVDNIEIKNTLDTNYTYMSNSNFSLYLVGNSSMVGNHKVKVMAFDFSGINVSIPNGPSNSHEWSVQITA